MSVEAEVSVAVVDDVRIVRVAGEYDAEGADTLAQALALPAACRAAGTVVDLAAVTFADSSFLHTLLAARLDHDRAGVPLVLAAMTPSVRRLLDVTDVARAFTVTPAVPVAADLVRAGTPGNRDR